MSFNVSQLWLIPILPLLAFIIIVFFTRPYKRLSSSISIAAIFLSLLVSLYAFSQASAEHAQETSLKWLEIGSAHLEVGILFDSTTAMMLIVVTLVSLLVQIFSQGYMAYNRDDDPYAKADEVVGSTPQDEGQGPAQADSHAAIAHGHDANAGHGTHSAHEAHAPSGALDPGYSRYFAFISLFTVSMLILVLANNLLLLYMGWELVGLCSYLLIGFWFHKPEAAAAAKKAFIVTRIGDFGFLIGILIIFFMAGTLNYNELFEMAEKKEILVGGWLTISAVLLFCGAIGKSAQFPLHVWLPDAMQGPTPVSALIHAATMVAAGVFMVARLFPIFEQSQQAMLTVAIIGGFTALFAATMGIVMNDIKQVMAYSTISQLGYMMMGLGAGGLVAGTFHLFNHAFFKALLFLGSGAVIYATGHVQDMRQMGGLRKRMPITYFTVLAASLSLAGIFPLSGFWSKDEILNDVLHAGDENGIYKILFAMGLIGAFITAFYATRLIIMTFHGDYRGPRNEKEAHSGKFGHQLTLDRISDPPVMMTLPLIVLGVLSVVSGWWNVNGAYTEFIAPGHHFEMNWTLAGISVLVALAGIGFSILIYGLKVIPVSAVTIKPLHTLVSNKYYLDDLNNLIVKHIVLGFSRIVHWIDQKIVDGIVNGIGHLTVWFGGEMSRVETGRLQNYALGAFAGALVIVFVIFFSGAK